MKATHILCASALCGLALLQACERQYEPVQVNDYTLANKAFVKVINNTVNSSRMILYIDGQKQSATLAGSTNPNISFNSATFVASTYPQNSGGYFAVDAGARNFVFRDTTTNTTLKPITIDATLGAGGYYSIYTADSLTNATGQIVVDDSYTTFDTSVTRIRFANMAYAPGNAPAVIFGSRSRGTLFGSVDNKTVTTFLNYKSNLFDSFYVVRASNVRDTLLRQAFSFLPNRPYTVIFRGRFNLTTAYSATNFFGRRLEVVAQDKFY